MNIEHEIIKCTNTTEIIGSTSVQSLWGGYGEIRRFVLKGGKHASIIAKHIQWPDEQNHPKGWNTELSHQRKLKSYQVERNWYKHFSSQTTDSCKIPRLIHSSQKENSMLLIMEDLDESGFALRLTPNFVTLEDAKNCLTWLAHFHAIFMGIDPTGLWGTGTYWHLNTRPDELEKMGNKKLKDAAKDIDSHLSKAKFHTLVHGDAKLANFCFSKTNEVAAVDFQYVGKGCGMKDVAYLISSCFDDALAEKYDNELLEHYFQQLEAAISKQIDFQELKEEWIKLYKYAWADFYRFLDGWSPGHWKMHSYSKRLMQEVLEELAK